MTWLSDASPYPPSIPGSWFPSAPINSWNWVKLKWREGASWRASTARYPTFPYFFFSCIGFLGINPSGGVPVYHGMSWVPTKIPIPIPMANGSLSGPRLWFHTDDADIEKSYLYIVSSGYLYGQQTWFSQYRYRGPRLSKQRIDSSSLR